MRRLLGVIAGIIVAMATITLIEWIGAEALGAAPPATGDAAAWGAFIAGIPLWLKLLVAFGWFAGAAFGGRVAIAVARWAGTGWVVAALVALAGIWNVVAIPHPLWMQAAAVIAPILGGWLALHLPRGRRRVGGLSRSG